MIHQTFVPRPAQSHILAYAGGAMGISAVPGSGKTFTLSLLAAQLVETLLVRGELDDREVLIVTFSNSAVENFRNRIGQFLNRERGLLPNVGYRVRTLHSLALEIVRERPALVGLSEKFDIVDEKISETIKRESMIAFLRSRPDALIPLIDPQHLKRTYSLERSLEKDALDIATTVIRIAKERNWEPFWLQNLLRKQSGTWPLLELGLHAYADYQRSLQVRGAVDYDDMIRLAIRALQTDDAFLARLQTRWPFILEDEAQDSSLQQEELLRLLTAAHGNWVRVGDPNQAINTTFTSANTRYLREFVDANADLARDLPNSGRSARPILELANRLIAWSRSKPTTQSHADSLTLPLIEPTPPGDPQPNPEPGEPPFHFHNVALDPDREIEMVVRSVQRWLPAHPDETAAILVMENRRAEHVLAALKQADIPYQDELLRMSDTSRIIATALSTILTYIAAPDTMSLLRRVWLEVWWPHVGMAHAARLLEIDTPAPALPPNAPVPEAIQHFGAQLQRGGEPERFVFPAAEDRVMGMDATSEEVMALGELFRNDLQRWTRAAILPVDELLLTVGNDLFSEPGHLALTHFLAAELGRIARESEWMRLPDLAKELEAIADSRRRLVNFPEGQGAYVARNGHVTIATMHRAKGLEWDRVYLMGVNTYSFPSGSDDDVYRGESWYARDRLNLVAEATAQLEQLAGGTLDDYMPGRATQAARHDVAAERLRLLYVGITRARKELIVTYNTGQKKDKPLAPAAAFVALQELGADVLATSGQDSDVQNRASA